MSKEKSFGAYDTSSASLRLGRVAREDTLAVLTERGEAMLANAADSHSSSQPLALCVWRPIMGATIKVEAGASEGNKIRGSIVAACTMDALDKLVGQQTSLTAAAR